MSGVKGRSGRKPDPVVKSWREAINKCMTPAKWNKIWNAMAAAAAEGDVQAARLLHDYCYGRPRPEPEAASGAASETSLSHIAYVLPLRDDKTPPPGTIVINQSDLDALRQSED